MKSLQDMEDHYVRHGHRGENLRKILKKDKRYAKTLAARKAKTMKNFSLNKAEKKKYVMSTDVDHEILRKIKQLERLPLTEEDSDTLKLIKSQLEHDWRKPLLKALEKIGMKYSREW